jgi:hypothetical protein
MAVGAVRKGIGAAAALTAACWSVVAWPQVAGDDGGTHLVFDVHSTLTADDNRSLGIGAANPETTLDTRLGFSFSSKTYLQSLEFAGQGTLRLSDRSGSNGSGFQDPNLRLSYARDTGNARLSVGANYRKSDASFFEPLLLSTGGISTIDFLATTGTVISWGTRAKLETGIDAPIGFILSASIDKREYSDTTDPNVYDTRNEDLNATMRLRPSDRTQIDLSLGYGTEDYGNANRTRRDKRNVSVSLTQELSSLLTLEGQIGYSRIQTDEVILGIPVSQTSDGVFGSVALMTAMPNGSASIRLSTDRDSLGVRNTLRFGRDMELPHGTLSADVGVSTRPGYGAQVVGSLAYGDKLPDASFSASLERKVTLDADNQDVAYTRLGLKYSRDLNEISSLGVAFDWVRSGDGGAGAITSVDRKTLRATYTRELTADWDVVAGYQYRHLDKSGTGQASSNSVFLTIGRKFALRP